MQQAIDEELYITQNSFILTSKNSKSDPLSGGDVNIKEDRFDRLFDDTEIDKRFVQSVLLATR